MANQNTTMSEESKNDVVQEARELLASGSLLLPLRVDGWHMSLHSGGWHIKNASDRIVMTVAFVPVEIESGKPAIDGNAPARHTAALLNSVPALCDEVEQLRSLNQTQADSIRHLQEQVKTADELHRVTVEGRVKAENEAVALRDACQKFVHWYAQNSSEFNRDSVFDAAVAALGKRACKECGALMDKATGERCDHCEGRIDAWLDDPLHGVTKC